MPYNCVDDKELCSKLSSSEVQFCTENGRFAFLSPLFGDLWTTYDVHLGSLESVYSVY